MASNDNVINFLEKLKTSIFDLNFVFNHDPIDDANITTENGKIAAISTEFPVILQQITTSTPDFDDRIVNINTLITTIETNINTINNSAIKTDVTQTLNGIKTGMEEMQDKKTFVNMPPPPPPGSPVPPVPAFSPPVNNMDVDNMNYIECIDNINDIAQTSLTYMNTVNRNDSNKVPKIQETLNNMFTDFTPFVNKIRDLTQSVPIPSEYNQKYNELMDKLNSIRVLLSGVLPLARVLELFDKKVNETSQVLNIIPVVQSNLQLPTRYFDPNTGATAPASSNTGATAPASTNTGATAPTSNPFDPFTPASASASAPAPGSASATAPASGGILQPRDLEQNVTLIAQFAENFNTGIQTNMTVDEVRSIQNDFITYVEPRIQEIKDLNIIPNPLDHGVQTQYDKLMVSLEAAKTKLESKNSTTFTELIETQKFIIQNIQNLLIPNQQSTSQQNPSGTSTGQQNPSATPTTQQIKSIIGVVINGNMNASTLELEHIKFSADVEGQNKIEEYIIKQGKLIPNIPGDRIFLDFINSQPKNIKIETGAPSWFGGSTKKNKNIHTKRRKSNIHTKRRKSNIHTKRRKSNRKIKRTIKN